LSTTNWCLYQYSVDFAPPEDRTAVRKGLLRQCREQLGAYIFDGSVLYTSSRLPEVKIKFLLIFFVNNHQTKIKNDFFQPFELNAERRGDSETISITIKRVGDMNRGDYHYLQFFNIIMRKCLDYLDLRLVGRNYFDPHNKVITRLLNFLNYIISFFIHLTNK